MYVRTQQKNLRSVTRQAARCEYFCGKGEEFKIFVGNSLSETQRPTGWWTYRINVTGLLRGVLNEVKTERRMWRRIRMSVCLSVKSPQNAFERL